MRVKKLLALLLSGAFFAGCLSGCDRTIIEHQFHTDTVTNTENVVSVIDTLEGIRKLSTFFKSLSGGNMQMIQMHDYEENFSEGELFENGVDMDEVEDFVQEPTTNGIFLLKEYDRQSDYSGFFAISEGAKMICDMLDQYLTEHPEERESFIKTGVTPALMTSLECTEDDEGNRSYYINMTLMAMSIY